jgi:pSer/pThr/pTyr-binding forkhead associated (FHA) protein
MAKLLIHESNGIREFEIVDEEIRIGRELDNTLRISDVSVSRHHALLRRAPQGFVIQDKQSANGVIVNGNRVEEALLMDGDQFLLGQIQVTFQNSDKSYKNGAATATTMPLNDAEAMASSAPDACAPGVSTSEPPNQKQNTYKEFGSSKPLDPFNSPSNMPNTTKGDGYMSHDNNPKMISKPGANPLLALLISIFVYGAGHVYNGQTAKWSVIALFFVVGSVLCALPGLFMWVLCIIDSYQTAQRLNSGESIPENEYSLPLLYNIVKVIDKDATCSRA